MRGKETFLTGVITSNLPFLEATFEKNLFLKIYRTYGVLLLLLSFFYRKKKAPDLRRLPQGSFGGHKYSEKQTKFSFIQPKIWKDGNRFTGRYLMKSRQYLLRKKGHSVPWWSGLINSISIWFLVKHPCSYIKSFHVTSGTPVVTFWSHTKLQINTLDAG